MACSAQGPRCGVASAILLAACFITGCAGTAPSDAVRVTTELSTRWEQLSHRLSLLEIAFVDDADGRGGEIVGQNEGGAFGFADAAVVRESFQLHSSAALRAMALEAKLVIPATGGIDPEAFVVTTEARADASPLDGSRALVAFIRGYRLSADEYPTPPAFATDPDLPYNPENGFTTQGLGVQLGEPRLEGGQVVVPVTARHSLGPADRRDMNAAIPGAMTWMRVDVLVLGAVGAASGAAHAEVGYTLSTPTYGKQTVHTHAADALQEVAVAGVPGIASGIVGLRGFDIWVNVPGRVDPACAVVQDELSFLGERVSGPGRYATELSVRLWDTSYDAVSGQARARADLFFSNASIAVEEGNVCLGVRGDVGLLQLDAPLTSAEVPPIELPLSHGALTRHAVRFEGTP